jgi:uncharacterized glyoxalase superfamily protein PhnB
MLPPAAITELVPLLFVQDIEQSAAFYRDRLGFKLTQTWEPDGRLAWCRLQRGAAAVMLQQACEEDGPPECRGHGVGLFFQCDDVERLFAEFSERGLSTDPPQSAFYGMTQIFVRDPDGYELCFQSRSHGMSPQS